jgi:FkbM family methyltransferase
MNGKTMLQQGLIRLLGYENYLYATALFRSNTLRSRKDHEDFRYFVSLIPAGSTILDIGANIGVTTYFLARQTRNCTIHSFEPIPQNYATLEKLVTTQRLANVKLYNIGLGEKQSELPMILPTINGVKRHALAQVWDEHSPFKEGITFTIPIKTIDGIKELDRQNIRAVKIDVEGFEYSVLLGAQEVLKSKKPLIFCELTDTPNSHKAVELLRSLGYQMKGYNSGKLVDASIETNRGPNYFFLPQH